MKKDTQHKKFEKVLMTSENIENDNLQKLRSVFPQFVKDGQIDFDSLQAFFKKEGILSGEEKYGLSWAGKSNAFRAIRMPSTGTLTPQPDESKNWDTTENLFIEGDNLEVLKLLQKNYANPGKIKMIYIDPPYNTGKDFIYKDNYTQNVSDYYEQTGQSKDGIKLTSNPESNGRYHSDWLTMMYPRLFLAHNLLKDDGVIFVSIDDNEVTNLRMIMDELFGEENFVSQFVWSGGRKNDSKLVSVSHEYTVCYAKNIDYLKSNEIIWRQKKKGLDAIYKTYESLKKKYKNDYKKIEQELGNWFKGLPNTDPAKRHSHYSNVDEIGVYFAADISWPGGGGPKYEVLHPLTKKPCRVPARGWMFSSSQKMKEVILENKVHFGIDESQAPCIKAYLTDREYQVPYSVFYQDGRAATKRLRELMGGDYFEHPKDELVLKDFVEFITSKDNNDIILDFFAGSGTTAHAVMDLNAEDGGNRKFICVQLPEATDENSEAYKAGYKNIAEISKERIRRAGAKIDKGDTGFKAFTLASSNYRRWNTITGEDDEQKLIKQAKLFTEKPLVDGYTESNIVYEILLKEGFDLNSKIKEIKKDGIHCYQIIDGEKEMTITFAKKLTKDQIEGLELPKDTIFVCFDSALDDTTKVNIMRNLMVKVI